jgi:hypothetical protein
MSNQENLHDKSHKNFKFQMKNINVPFIKKQELNKPHNNSINSDFKIIKKSKQEKNDDNFFEAQKINFNRNSITLFDKEKSEKQSNQHINSFSSVFRRDHEEIQGITRVFRKSVSFFALSIISFGFLISFSINLFQANLLALAVSTICFIVFTNIFYIIVADKSYIWLNLIAQFLVLLVGHSFLKLSFTPITLISALFIILLSYLSYTELEKVQLGSRLFTIGQITKESTSVLLTMITIILALGMYNSIMFNGVQKIFTDNALNNSFVFNKYIMGEKKTDSTLNSFLGLTAKSQATGKYITFGQFISEHFRNNKDVVLDGETSQIREKCLVDFGKDVCVDDVAVIRVRNSRLEEWRLIAYPKINYTLDTPLDDAKFREVVKQYYVNQVCLVEKGEDCPTNKEIPSLKTDNEAATSTKAKIADAFTKDINISNSYLKYFSLDRSNIIPILLTLIVFIILTLIKGLFGYIVLTISWIFWQILKLFKFVKIEIETVEAEVVSI